VFGLGGGVGPQGEGPAGGELTRFHAEPEVKGDRSASSANVARFSAGNAS
jgi:hypothetical protein